MLGALPGDPVELGQCQLELAMVQRLDGLHGAFAEGLAADDQCTVVVLHGTGENLRGRGREAVDQQRHRPFVEGTRVLVFQHVDTAVSVAYQHGRALVDKQAGQLGGFLQEPPPLLRRSMTTPSTFSFCSSVRIFFTSRVVDL